MPLKLYNDAEKSGLNADPEHRIGRNAFKNGIRNFLDNFTYQNGSAGPLVGDPIRLDTGSLFVAVPTAREGQIVMISIYHGLVDAERRVIHGIRFIQVDAQGKMDPELSSADGSLPTHEVTLNGNVVPLTAAGIAAWAGYQSSYKSNVWVRRADPNDPPEQQTDGSDPKVVTFPWLTEVFRMYDENSKQDLGETKRIEISNFACFHQVRGSAPKEFNGVDGFRHGIAFHVVKQASEGAPWVPMLADTNHVTVYHNMGADLGHLCPPRCRKTTEVGS